MQRGGFLRRLGVPAIIHPDPASPPDHTDVFCHPTAGPQAATLLETGHFRVLASRFPLAPGHLLIVPKQHIPTFADVPVAWHRELEELIRAGRRFQRDMYGREAFGREQGSPAGSPGDRQAVHHAHYHLIPTPAPVRVPDIPGGRRIRSFLDLARYRMQSGFYHYIEAGGVRMVMPDDGPAVAAAEKLLCDALGSVWNPVKLQATKLEDPEAKPVYDEAVRRWLDWFPRQRDLRAHRGWSGPAAPADGGLGMAA